MQSDAITKYLAYRYCWQTRIYLFWAVSTKLSKYYKKYSMNIIKTKTSMSIVWPRTKDYSCNSRTTAYSHHTKSESAAVWPRIDCQH